MEKTNEPTDVSCIIGSYQLTVSYSNNRLHFRAYSEALGRLFEEELTNEILPANLKENYVECLVIFGLIEDAVAGKQVVLNDNGELRFGFTVRLGRADVKKEISIMLKEVSMD
jgi:hypothetical protein